MFFSYFSAMNDLARCVRLVSRRGVNLLSELRLLLFVIIIERMNVTLLFLKKKWKN